MNQKQEAMIDALPPSVTKLCNLYGREYWLIPAYILYYNPKVIVEVGTDKGTSATMIDNVMADDTTYFTIDVRDCQAAVAHTRAICIHADSAWVGQRWHMPIDFLYIDGRHEYKNVFDELTLFAPHTRQCILLHDIQIVSEVNRAILHWLEVGDNANTWKFTPYIGPEQIGMGILERIVT